MVEVATWQDEILRQNSRLASDLVARQTGVTLAYVLFGLYLPFWLIFLFYLLNIGSEALQNKLANDFTRQPSRRIQFAIIANSMFGFAAFSMMAVLVWQSDDPMFKFISTLSLVGTMLNIAAVRSTHRNLGLISGIPPSLALLMLPLSTAPRSQDNWMPLLATCGVAVLIGYLVTTLFQSHRAQNELVQAREDAKASSKAKSRFLSSMSHEIRTPLNTILGYSQILRDSSEKHAASDYGAAIEGAAHRLRMLVDDVLDLASFTEGEIRFNPVTAAFRQEFSAALSASVAESVLRGVDIENVMSTDVPELGRFDPFLLRKCLSHLSTFILESHPRPDTKTLCIHCSPLIGKTNWLCVVIGFGKPDRGTDTDIHQLTSLDENEGLSLALVHQIAKVMGASASIMKTAGGALTARLDFPFIAVAEPPAKGVETVYGHLRVLVVDDIATNRFVIGQLLRSLRADLAEADSGAEALEWLKAESFDVVLLDMNMPDIDGEATFHAIRNSGEAWASVPVIAITAGALADQRTAYLKLGFNGYLAKPVDKRLLWSEILQVVPPPPPL